MFDELAKDLVDLFGRGVEGDLAPGEFERLALRVFRWQYEANPVYRRFAAGRDRTLETVRSWTDVPAVPATAFKHLPLLSAPDGRVQRLFRTSGTSGASSGRGVHRVPEMELYRASALPNMKAHLLAGLEPPVSVLALLPSPEEVPDSSLSAMAAFATEAWGDEGSGWFVDPEEGVREQALWEALASAEERGRPVLLLGTAFSFVHALDAAAAEGRRYVLPAGTRVMETGGFKGRSRSVPRAELYAGIERRFGVSSPFVVNEYGMTELLSQFYEPVLRPECAGHRPTGLEDRWHVGPPWVRTRVLDPATLDPVPEGETGLLCHFDLANAGSVACVLTEDLGTRVEGGFRLRGRAEGAELRGCSLAVEEIVAGRGSPA